MTEPAQRPLNGSEPEGPICLPSPEKESSATIADEQVVLWVNGQQFDIVVDPRTTLLDALRELLGLTGAKPGCNQGTCGACTVHLDDRRHLSCLLLAVAVTGQRITTIEGLAGENDALHPMQQAFVNHDALQCGYCTPGQIMSAIGCIAEGHAGSDMELREYMSGNLCRCGAYPNIIAAIRDVLAGA